MLTNKLDQLYKAIGGGRNDPTKKVIKRATKALAKIKAREGLKEIDQQRLAQKIIVLLSLVDFQ